MAKSKKQHKGLPVFLLVVTPLLAIGFSTFVLARGVNGYLATSRYFDVRELKVDGISDERYIALMNKDILGVNIFDIDMRKLSEKIRQRFPTFYSVTVSRVLPSELRIVAKERLPVALVKKDVYYVLDADGVALMKIFSDKELSLPLIVGLDHRLADIKLGDRLETGALRKPLVLAKALRSRRFAIKVAQIDATDPPRPFLRLETGLEVKLRDKEYEAQLEFLSSIFKSLGDDLATVNYIDLRPREPVIALKEKEKDKKK